MKTVSVLLMTYNSKQHTLETLQSIEKQDYPSIEIVISDGGSTDGTIEMINEMKNHSRHSYNFISEPDHGLYDALNKDIQRATGDYLIVCNDLYTSPSALSKLVTALEEENADGAHCDLVYTADKRVTRYWHMGTGKIQNGWLPGHPTLLLKKEVYQKYGFYNTDYKVSADYEFMIRILKDGNTRLAYVPVILVQMFYGGTSNQSTSSYWTSISEGINALKRNGVAHPLWITFLRTVRVSLQFLNTHKAEKLMQSNQ